MNNLRIFCRSQLLLPHYTHSNVSIPKLKCLVVTPISSSESWNFRSLNTTWLLKGRREDWKAMLNTLPKLDEGAEGEKHTDLDTSSRVTSMFPTPETMDVVYDGVKYSELPICGIRVSKNNTVLHLSDHQGNLLIRHSCGREGFKNAKKKTNIAGQAAAITMAQKAAEIGVKNVRVTIKGLGPGRMSSLKGLQMGGFNIVSISDWTPASETGPRSKKARRL